MNDAEIKILKYVQELADQAHGEQVRKYTGERYIVHPVRVMQTVKEVNGDVRVLAAALLHDVLEDTPVTESELEERLLAVMDPEDAKQVLTWVVELTDVYIKQDYPKMKRAFRKEKEAARLALASAEAQSIKYADILDNVGDIVKLDSHFAVVYVREAKSMLDVMTRGQKELRSRALALVEQHLTPQTT